MQWGAPGALPFNPLTPNAIEFRGQSSSGMLGGCGRSGSHWDMGAARVAEGGALTEELSAFSSYIQTAATVDSQRLRYERLKLTGVGSGGECHRVYTEAAATGHTAIRAQHSTVGFDTTGRTITGLLAVNDNCLMVPNATQAVGTGAIVNMEINGENTLSTVSGRMSFLRAIFGGNATAIAAMEKIVYFAEISCGSYDSGDMVYDNTTSGRIKIYITGLGVRYICMSNS